MKNLFLNKKTTLGLSKKAEMESYHLSADSSN